MKGRAEKGDSLMKLNRLTPRIWVYPYEEERDRPNLVYVRGDRWSLAVDAGHSADHTRAFYQALEDAGLPTCPASLQDQGFSMKTLSRYQHEWRQ